MRGKEDTAVRICALRPEDIECLCTLAAEIWRHHYPGIISVAQIEYMLAQRYNQALLREEMQRRDLWWDQLLVAGRMTGYASYLLGAKRGEMKLDKLYVHCDQQRKGYGGMLIDRAVTIARAYGCETLALAVNKHNRSAIAAYEKHGFRIAEAVVKDIGGGFVMDDYVMIKDV